ncbi:MULTISPECIES: hypothetical protein [unclassified Pseudomonas]|uniref:hypothetical protein n=1 Tax=unclassified Pseudomonas TaxID=196821 RepID=UPI000BD7A2EE|nr:MULTISPECIES: hypothetical protein [unclassified Pseudomonas]PVZ19914.1 hypothetical protein F474_00505 [Pseudomonas sp. URIL14HWK12:I12]PVZ26980.1 hypothetical protein F470_00160 [Pseudomonas sp. URIL14HWK12:I10]PVZ37869.1 hypothetical protein F472_00505 [Pseudomonas sp. URIL14HWK12:I11]SNZ05343.1 hypothetical protein SAMN05660463_00899 [Pseudomonas sp. URIL14HWK12:I9]
MAGLIIKSSEALVTLDMTSRISRSVGNFETGTGGGSRTLSWPPGTRWFVRVPLGSTGLKGKGPAVSLSGDTISWAFSYRSGFGEYPVSARIYYGVR